MDGMTMMLKSAIQSALGGVDLDKVSKGIMAEANKRAMQLDRIEKNQIVILQALEQQGNVHRDHNGQYSALPAPNS